MTRATQPLPLVFSFRELVIGNGFIASVQMCGRALMDEADETWLTGIAPVGFSGGGMDRTEAFGAFRRAWFEILVDIANESADFASFRELSLEFLRSSQEAMTREWEEALAIVRANGVTDDRLRRAPDEEHQVSFSVDEILPEHFAPDKNQVDSGLKAAA